MSAQELVFLLLSIVTGGFAIMTVTSKNLVHAALALAATLAGIAGVFLTLAADFVALVQLVVYVGAIAVLFLFGLMLTRAPIGREALDSQNRGLGAGIAVALFGVLTALIVQGFEDSHQFVQQPVTGPQADEIGLAIFSNWVFPFELVSLLLLGALVGSILLSRREDQDDDTADDLPMVVTPIDVGDMPAIDTDAPTRKQIVVGARADGEEGES